MLNIMFIRVKLNFKICNFIYKSVNYYTYSLSAGEDRLPSSGWSTEPQVESSTSLIRKSAVPETETHRSVRRAFPS